MDTIEKIKELEKQISELKQRTADIEDTHKDELSLVILSGEMDKILAAMIIAVGAAAMDTVVKIFFTFWSISALRDPKKHVNDKNFISKIFGMLLPKGKNKLKLSNMNMAGMGPKMIQRIMKKQNVMSLDEMFKQAGELGIEMNICEMSMDLMGFKKEEMIDYPNLGYAGVATFLADANESRNQLFI